jgi:hypothetical protein
MVENNLKAPETGSRFTQPVFLIGFFRSGTSLLHAVLNQHPQIALMYECNVWDFPEFLSEKRFRHNWLERLEFLNQALSRHRLIFGGSQRGLENVRTPEQLYRTFTENKGPAFWGEKAPVYCTRLRKLFRRYPDGSFIMIRRDPLEIYRSIMRAGREARFFRRPGILSRFIFNQEQMIRQAARISRAGGRVYCVSYDDLIDKTKATCQDICCFLGIEFDEKMLDLTNADFSAVFPVSARHHEHLRRGVIGRQQFSEEILPAPVAGKLQRFRNRWNRLHSEWDGAPAGKNGEVEPSQLERLYYHGTGSFLQVMDSGRRALIEFLPLPWLRTYRLLKENLLLRHAEKRLSLRELLSTHGITLLTSYAILASVVGVDYSTGPDVTMAPFYMMPSAILTLIVGRRWGIFAAAVAVICWSAIQSVQLKGSLELGIVTWNSIMRFLVFLTVVFLLDRVRSEGKPAGPARKADI